MTDEKALMSQIHDLPEKLKLEVALFVENLKKSSETQSEKKHKRRKAGSHPGMFVMAPNFDDPLEEF